MAPKTHQDRSRITDKVVFEKLLTFYCLFIDYLNVWKITLFSTLNLLN